MPEPFKHNMRTSLLGLGRCCRNWVFQVFLKARLQELCGSFWACGVLSPNNSGSLELCYMNICIYTILHFRFTYIYIYIHMYVCVCANVCVCVHICTIKIEGQDRNCSESWIHATFRDFETWPVSMIAASRFQVQELQILLSIPKP